MEEIDTTATETKASYEEIRQYIENQYNVKVSNLYIAQVKRKCGIAERKNYNLAKKENPKIQNCPPDKEKMIMEALRHFQMIK